MARMRAPQRRRQLLEHAARLFAQRGYRGTTTAELAQAAGITEPILYRHFASKLELFVTLIDEVGGEVIETWRSMLSEIDDPHQRLVRLLSANPATHDRGRGIYRVIFQAMTELDGEPAIAEAIRRHVVRLHAFVREELKALQEQKVVRSDEPAEALAWLLVDVAIGFGMVAPLEMPRHSGRAGQQAMQRLLRELLGEAVMP